MTLKPDLQTALNNVDLVFKDIRDIADEITKKAFEGANELIRNLDSINNLSIDLIREYMLNLSICAYSLGEAKEKSAVKAECAEALRKERVSTSFIEAAGTNGAKENAAVLASSNEVVAEALCNLVANLYKTKLDQIYRMVDVLKSILMSRMQEAKLINTSAAEDIDSYKAKMRLNENY